MFLLWSTISCYSVTIFQTPTFENFELDLLLLAFVINIYYVYYKNFNIILKYHYITRHAICTRVTRNTRVLEC